MIAAKGLRLERMLEIGLALHVSSMADKSLEIKSISAFMQQVSHVLIVGCLSLPACMSTAWSHYLLRFQPLQGMGWYIESASRQ